MATCKFCGQKFQSKQGVKAHLKGCAAYKGSLPKAEVPQALPKATATGPEVDRVTRLRQEVEAEQARLKLREVQAAHGELDEREAAKTKRQCEEAERVKREAQEREQMRLKAEQEALGRRLREMTEQRRSRQRRELMQSVKDEVIGRAWKFFGYQVPSDVKAKALQEIEPRLSALAVDELPREELIEIAEGIRDEIYSPTLAAQDEAKGREEARRRQEAAERRAAEEKERQKRQEQWRQEQAAREQAEKKRDACRWERHSESRGSETEDFCPSAHERKLRRAESHLEAAVQSTERGPRA